MRPLWTGRLEIRCSTIIGIGGERFLFPLDSLLLVDVYDTSGHYCSRVRFCWRWHIHTLRTNSNLWDSSGVKHLPARHLNKNVLHSQPRQPLPITCCFRKMTLLMYCFCTTVSKTIVAPSMMSFEETRKKKAKIVQLQKQRLKRGSVETWIFQDEGHGETYFFYVLWMTISRNTWR